MKLTIAIPTYNFAAFIGATLRSILDQSAGLDVEVLVVDGASTDHTEEVVRSFPSVRYVQLDRRGGIDADMDHAVRTANGDFVWLCSADDLLVDGALASVLSFLHPEVDLLLGCHTNCDRNMVSQGVHPVFADRGSRVLDLGLPAQRQQWLAEGVSTEAVFSFMSTLIVKRSTWINAVGDHFVGTCWSHVARLFRVAAIGHLRCHFSGELWIARRGENDSFMDRGVVHRYRISFFLLDIFGAIFGINSIEQNEVRRLLQWEYSFLSLVAAAKTVIKGSSDERDREWQIVIAGLFPSARISEAVPRLLLTQASSLRALVRLRDTYLRTPLPRLRRRLRALRLRP